MNLDKDGMPIRIYTHNKTGKRYRVWESIINCTNAQDGQLMIVYESEESLQKFCRESKEFYEKFTKAEQ